MRIAIFPGSFDPPTLGHIDLITRASHLCDRLVVGVLHNPDKKTAFSAQERVEMLTEAIAHISNVEVMHFSGLLVDLARQENADFVVRGVRGEQDLAAETSMAFANGILLPGLETVLLPASAQLEAVSSSLVRQIAQFGGDVRAFVPASAVDEIQRRFYNK